MYIDVLYKWWTLWTLCMIVSYANLLKDIIVTDLHFTIIVSWYTLFYFVGRSF